MDIQSLSMNMSQTRVQEQAAVSVQAMAMRSMKDMGAALERLMDSANTFTDPAKGNNIDILA